MTRGFALSGLEEKLKAAEVKEEEEEAVEIFRRVSHQKSGTVARLV